jgi:hypothetical protein
MMKHPLIYVAMAGAVVALVGCADQTAPRTVSSTATVPSGTAAVVPSGAAVTTPNGTTVTVPNGGSVIVPGGSTVVTPSASAAVVPPPSYPVGGPARISNYNVPVTAPYTAPLSGTSGTGVLEQNSGGANSGAPNDPRALRNTNQPAGSNEGGTSGGSGAGGMGK